MNILINEYVIGQSSKTYVRIKNFTVDAKKSKYVGI